MSIPQRSEEKLSYEYLSPPASAYTISANVGRAAAEVGEAVRQSIFYDIDVMSVESDAEPTEDGTGGMGTREAAAFTQRIRQNRTMLGTATWKDILDAECSATFAQTDPDLLEECLTHVAAVCVKWRRNLSRRRMAADDLARRQIANGAP
jgi:hypothetical protein